MPTLANDKNFDDWDLLGRRERSDDAFAILFKRHKDFVYRLAMGFSAHHDLAEEITQEVFMRIFRGRSRWKPRAKFTTWVYRVTLNTSRELMRKRNREQMMRDKFKLENSVQPRHLSDDESAPDLQKIIPNLPDRQREALVLRYYERLSIRETAKIMGCREGTIKSHLHKALNNMRRHLGAKG